MERPYLNLELRRLVANRADYLCEYCLISEQDTILGCAIDHIISIKHGGKSDPDNLAYCCVYCNRFNQCEQNSPSLFRVGMNASQSINGAKRHNKKSSI